MRRSALLLVLLFAVACDREPVAPAAEPTLSIADAPAAVGIVWRGDSAVATLWSDPKTGLQVVAGMDIVEYCSFIWDPDTVAFQIMGVGGHRVIQQKAGLVRASVWGFPDFDCTLYMTRLPLATGEASLTSTTNNLNATPVEGLGIYGLNLHGQLTTSSGETAIMSALWRAQLQDGVVFRVLQSVVTLK